MKTIVDSPRAPKAVGPYRQAIKVQGFIFCSGQVGLDPVTNTMVSGGIQEQTQQVMENLKAVLEAAGSNFAKVVKATCYLSDMNNYNVFNEVYGSFFPDDPPARETVQVARLPKDALVEVSVIAVEEGVRV